MKRKTVVVLESGRLPELNITGPITTPTRIALNNIAKMVQNGKNVEECDPEDPMNKSKRIKLTTENVGKDNFGSNNKSEIKQEFPKTEKPPVEPKKEDAKVEESPANDNQKPEQNQDNNQKNNKKK